MKAPLLFPFSNTSCFFSGFTVRTVAVSQFEPMTFYDVNDGDMALALLRRPTRIFLHGYDMLLNF